MFAIARENATCDDSFDSSLQLLVIAAGAGRLPQMVIFRALQPVHSNTIMTFLAREPHREISEMIYWISGPRSGSPGFPPAEGLAAVHKERYLQFFTEEQFERLGSGRERRGRRGVRVNWRGRALGGSAWLTRSRVLTVQDSWGGNKDPCASDETPCQRSGNLAISVQLLGFLSGLLGSSGTKQICVHLSKKLQASKSR